MAADLRDPRDPRLVIGAIGDGQDIAIGFVDGLGAQHWTRAGVPLNADPDWFRAAVLDAVERIGFAAMQIGLRG